MRLLIEIALALAALFCGIMYGWSWRAAMRANSDYQLAELSEYSFRVALCGILALGFLGLLLK